MWVGINLSTLIGEEREGGVEKGEAGDGKIGWREKCLLRSSERRKKGALI